LDPSTEPDWIKPSPVQDSTSSEKVPPVPPPRRQQTGLDKSSPEENPAPAPANEKTKPPIPPKPSSMSAPNLKETSLSSSSESNESKTAQPPPSTGSMPKDKDLPMTGPVGLMDQDDGTSETLTWKPLQPSKEL